MLEAFIFEKELLLDYTYMVDFTAYRLVIARLKNMRAALRGTAGLRGSLDIFFFSGTFNYTNFLKVVFLPLSKCPLGLTFSLFVSACAIPFILYCSPIIFPGLLKTDFASIKKCLRLL